MLCNYLQNVAAITYIFVLQLSTFLFYNKHIIYCMVHRLKRKLKKVDVNAEHIIISVKEVGYSLKTDQE